MAAPESQDVRTEPQVIRAWCLYDWANSAFATTVMAGMFPPFFRSLATAAGLASADATAAWGYTTAIALLLTFLMAPLLGAMADLAGQKKRYLCIFAGVGVLLTACLAGLQRESWRLGSLLFIGANIGFAGSIVFYESLLPHIAGPEWIDRVSARGYALGYAGGGLLLAVNASWVLKPTWFGMPDPTFAVKASFLSAALWWAVFTVPLLRTVPEPRMPALDTAPGASWREGFARLRGTFREIRRYRALLLFLIAFWIYSDGIGTIIKMATAYGDEIGIALGDMIVALLMTQIIGIPCTIFFGKLAGRIGAKTAIIVALGIYTLICIAGFFMRTAVHFYILAALVGTAQGGSQALSRSLFGAMVPRHKSAEFFGFFSASAKLAGICGPLLFGVISQLTGQSRLSILALIAFFLVGAYLLGKVDVPDGIRAARASEAEHAKASTAGRREFPGPGIGMG